MDVSLKDFECFEQQFTELISEFQTLSTTESYLRNTVRAEAARAEAAEAARDAAVRATTESQASAAAATASAAQATRALAVAQDELVTVKMKFEFADRQRALLEENCIELNNKLNTAEKELQQLQPLQSANTNLQQQYIVLQHRIQTATEDARNEACRLERELVSATRGAGAGAELRTRARLAAAAHARDRRLAHAELTHAARELQGANAEITRLNTVIVELQCQLSIKEEKNTYNTENTGETIAELKSALEAERSGTSRLEKTLALAIADNATLAAKLHNNDNDSEIRKPSPGDSPCTHDCPIDSFLAE